MTLTHLKKEKVNSWSMATLDKLSSEKTNFGSGCWPLSTRCHRNRSCQHPVMDNLSSSGGVGIHHALEKCPSRLWPYADTKNTNNFLLMSSAISADYEEICKRCLDLQIANFLLLVNPTPMFSDKIHSHGYLRTWI